MGDGELLPQVSPAGQQIARLDVGGNLGNITNSKVDRSTPEPHLEQTKSIQRVRPV